MSILKTLREKLASEDYTKLLDAVGDDFDWDMVPRSRLDKVIKQRNALRSELAGAPQDQSKGAGSHESDDGDDEDDFQPNKNRKTLKKSADSGQGQEDGNLEALQQKHQKEMQDLKVRYSALDKLRAAGARDAELILNAGLLDLSQAKLSKDGNAVEWPTGDKDPFAVLKADTSRAYLFGADSGVPSGTGREGGLGSEGGALGALGLKEAYAAAEKSGDMATMARLTREAFEQKVQL